jgi:hypothetical protein
MDITKQRYVNEIIDLIIKTTSQWSVFIPGYKKRKSWSQSIWVSTDIGADIETGKKYLFNKLWLLTINDLIIVQSTLLELIRIKSKMAIIGIPFTIQYSNVNDNLPINGTTYRSKFGIFEIGYKYEAIPDLDQPVVLSINEGLMRTGIVTWGKNEVSKFSVVANGGKRKSALTIDLGNYALDYAIYSRTLDSAISMTDNVTYLYVNTLHIKNFYLNENLFGTYKVCLDPTNMVETTKNILKDLPDFINQYHKAKTPADIADYLSIRSKILVRKFKLVFFICQILIYKDFIEEYNRIQNRNVTSYTLSYKTYESFTDSVSVTQGINLGNPYESKKSLLELLLRLSDNIIRHESLGERLGFKEHYIGLHYEDKAKFDPIHKDEVMENQNHLDSYLNNLLDILVNYKGEITQYSTKRLSTNTLEITSISLNPEVEDQLYDTIMQLKSDLDSEKERADSFRY